MFVKSGKSDTSGRSSHGDQANGEGGDELLGDLSSSTRARQSKRASINDMRGQSESRAMRSMSAVAKSYMYTPKEQLAGDEPRKEFALVSKHV
jgi:hypothetical protein